VPLPNGCADLVYTGKGALVWMPDIEAWAVEMARLLRPGGHLFLHEGHPATELWTWDLDEPRIRPDRATSVAPSSATTTASRRTGLSCGSGRLAKPSPRLLVPGWRSGTWRSTPNRSGAWVTSTQPLSMVASRTRSVCWRAAPRRHKPWHAIPAMCGPTRLSMDDSGRELSTTSRCDEGRETIGQNPTRVVSPPRVHLWPTCKPASIDSLARFESTRTQRRCALAAHVRCGRAGGAGARNSGVPVGGGQGVPLDGEILSGR